MPPTGAKGCAVLLLVAGVGGCFSDRPSTEPTGPGTGAPAVEIENFAFVPAQLSVATGTIVTWTNHDQASHTVTAAVGGAFDSGAFGQGMTFQLTAGAPGTYNYRCQIHPFMQATLTVTP